MGDNNIASRLHTRMNFLGKWHIIMWCLLSIGWFVLLVTCVDSAEQIVVPRSGVIQPPDDTAQTPDGTAQPTDGTGIPSDDTVHLPDDNGVPTDDTNTPPDNTNDTNQPPDDTVKTPVATIHQVATGSSFSCMLADNTVYCWGRGLEGQLGNGFGSSHYQPQSIQWIFQGEPKRLVLGGGIGCLFDDSDRLYCWGVGTYGQLGINSTPNRYSATPLYQTDPVPARYDSASIGNTHSCSLAFNYTVWCWGSSYYGQLGNNAFDDSKSKPSALIPQQVTTLPSGERYPVSISSGAHHSCAVINDGSVYCWGHAFYGQLGNSCLFDVPDGAISCNDDKATPQQIELFDGTTESKFAVSISSGANHTCVLAKDNSLYCFGRGESGQLGVGSTSNYTTPVHVGSVGTNTQAMALGDNHTCLLLNNGSIQCFGSNNRGQLGINSTAVKRTPVRALFASGIQLSGVTAGRQHTCAWNSESVWCWGDNTHGQVGNGSVDDLVVRPTLIAQPSL